MPFRRLPRLEPRAAYAAPGEPYRVVRSNLLVALADLERPTVIITSADAGEGKTATTAHLAASLASAGRRVVLVDFDLRHPDVHHWFGVENDRGVSDVLLERCSLDDALRFIDLSEDPRQATRGLYLLTTGPQVPNPAELLGAGRTARMLEALAGVADIVLIDTPPVLLVADTLVIGRMVAGAVLVVDTHRTPIPSVQQAKDALIRNQTRLLGLVLNKYNVRHGEPYAYGYGDALEG